MTWLFAVVLALMLLLAPAGDPNVQFRSEALAAPSMQHWFGTDSLGHDLWSRFVHGGRWSLTIGALGAALSLGVAWVVGSTAGWFGGWIDTAVMWLCDVMLGLPWLYLLIALRAVLPLNADPREVALMVVAALSLTGWSRPARLVRGIVLTERERGWVEAARGFCAAPLAIYFRHVFPPVRDVLATQAMLLLPRFVLAELTFSFTGAGADASTPSWGALVVPLKQAYLLGEYWWLALPATAIAIYLVCFSLLTGRLAVEST